MLESTRCWRNVYPVRVDGELFVVEKSRMSGQESYVQRHGRRLRTKLGAGTFRTRRKGTF